MSRDLTREQVRQVIKLGLQATRGSYKTLVPLLRMSPSDYKRFLNFLRKHHCQVPFQTWRAVPVAAELPVESHAERHQHSETSGRPRRHH
jgi:hypothetical protein